VLSKKTLVCFLFFMRHPMFLAIKSKIINAKIMQD